MFLTEGILPSSWSTYLLQGNQTATVSTWWWRSPSIVCSRPRTYVQTYVWMYRRKTGRSSKSVNEKPRLSNLLNLYLKMFWEYSVFHRKNFDTSIITSTSWSVLVLLHCQSSTMLSVARARYATM